MQEESTPNIVRFTAESGTRNPRIDKIASIVGLLTESNGGHAVGEGNIKDAVSELSELTELVEDLENSNGFWGRTCSRLTQRKIALENENRVLREAIHEMERMLPVIEMVESSPSIWNMVRRGTGLSTANGYRKRLKAALDKIKEQQ